jgi:ATP-binding cassette subfamily F protein 3
MSTLTFTGIHKSYGAQDVLRGATFFVGPGRKTALVGANGAGKTTLLRLAAGQERPDAGRVTLQPGTRFGVLEQEPLVGDARSVLEVAQRPSLAHREAWTNLLALESTLEHGADADHLAAYDAAHQHYQHLGGYDCETRAREVLAGLGFPTTAWEKPVAVLSGGERTRLALAQLLVLQPDLLLLDEPTNHVDWEACEWLQDHLARYPGAALIVSHDRFFLDQVVDEVVLLADGATRTYAGNYTAFVHKQAAERAQAEEQFQRARQEIERQEAIIQRLRSHRKFSSMHSREKTLARLGEPEPPARDGRRLKILAGPAATTGQVALTARDLAFGYGSRVLFSGLSFTLERGERLGIIGPNGAGKSSLLKLLVGQLAARSGEVSLGFRAEPAYFAQDLGSLDPALSVLETLDGAASLTTTQLFQTLHQFLFVGDAIEKPIAALSGGERTRLALACLLARRPNVLVLDEPTNHLDIPSREAVETALAAFPGALLVASHDRYFLDRVPTRLLELRPGLHRFFDGSYERYREIQAGRSATTVQRLAATARGRTPARGSGAPSPAKRLRELEKAIETAEGRLRELTTRLADPGTYQNGGAGELSAEYDRLTASLDPLYREWSELAELVPAARP